MTGDTMENSSTPTTAKPRPNPERMAILRSLPLEIKGQITGEEAHAFLYEETVPDSLFEKLKRYLVPEAE
jgi:hypothetical protein